MKLFTIPFSLFLIIMLTIVGCNKTVPEPDLTTKKLYELYPGNIQSVDYIEIRNGSTGELKSYTDQEQVQKWMNKVSEQAIVPDPNQEGRTGFLYGVSLFENKELKLSITNNSISGIYYIHNEELANEIQALFESTP